MKIAVCIQAQDTGRILFFRKEHDGMPRWTWVETGDHFNWHHSGSIDALRRRVSTYVEVADRPVEWFNSKRQLNIIHFRIPEERSVYSPDQYQWRSLFEFPDDYDLHPYILEATTDLLFLENLTTIAE